ncbi:Protein FAM92A [Galemys pyrenaicus]|uniref:Protein FAM92A n=1 Tax=Galemys pyrenaicus TaxID=202257 RepID=A0A8J5ZPQ7_GALPY|nr:Protein FAM92A [Galemys pyrenaicus]
MPELRGPTDRENRQQQQQQQRKKKQLRGYFHPPTTDDGHLWCCEHSRVGMCKWAHLSWDMGLNGRCHENCDRTARTNRTDRTKEQQQQQQQQKREREREEAAERNHPELASSATRSCRCTTPLGSGVPMTPPIYARVQHRCTHLRMPTLECSQHLSSTEVLWGPYCTTPCLATLACGMHFLSAPTAHLSKGPPLGSKSQRLLGPQLERPHLGAPVVGPQPRVSWRLRVKMLRRSLENRDAQTRQLQDAVTNVEKHFESCAKYLLLTCGKPPDKTTRQRDKADLLDYRQAEVERLEAKVVEPLKAYETIVKMKRDDLKATLTARNPEAKQLTQLERTRQRNPSDRHKIDEEDLEVFRNSLYPPDYSCRLDIVRANSKSPLQRSLSAKCVSGTGQVSTSLLRKDQQADDDEEDEDDLDVTEEEN